MTITPLTIKDTAVFKAIGILLIVFHNYLHWVAPSTGENEMDFAVQRIYNLYYGLCATPLEAVNLLLSYFGHYGVQIFIFISGAGLTMSMLRQRSAADGYGATCGSYGIAWVNYIQ